LWNTRREWVVEIGLTDLKALIRRYLFK
jgi:hypothetical protein